MKVVGVWERIVVGGGGGGGGGHCKIIGRTFFDVDEP